MVSRELIHIIFCSIKEVVASQILGVNIVKEDGVILESTSAHLDSSLTVVQK